MCERETQSERVREKNKIKVDASLTFLRKVERKGERERERVCECV